MSLISIIITTHNRPHLLARAIESARVAGTNIEIIVVDDASADGTRDAFKTLPGINYVRVDGNQGVAGARNIGLLASSGTYVTFLDDDDRRLPDSLDEQVRLLESAERAGLIYGQAIVGDQSGQATDQKYPLLCPEGDVFWDLLDRNFIPCGSAVFRRSCLNAVGLLDSGISGLDDWDLWIRIAELYPVIALERPVVIWRRSTPASQQGTSQAASLVSQAVRQFRRSWMKLPRAASAPREMKRTAWQHFSANMAAHLGWEAIRALRVGYMTLALRNLMALSRLGPMAPLRLVQQHEAARFPRLRIVRDGK